MTTALQLGLILSTILLLPAMARGEPTAPRSSLLPGHTTQIQALIADVGHNTVLRGGVSFDRIRRKRDRVVYDLRDVTTQAVVGSVQLLHRSAKRPQDQATRHFALRIRVADPKHAHWLQQACASITAHDTADHDTADHPALFKVLPRPLPSHHIASRRQRDLRWAELAIAFAMLVLLTAIARLRRSAGLTWRRRHRFIDFRFKPTHALPAIIQLLIFSYWALYYRDLSGYFPLIGLELAYAFLLSAGLDLHRHGRWTATIGPVPITLSTNLFVLFLPGDAYLTLLAITIALLSQRIIVREGRHVLNPSSFGVATVGLLTLLIPQLGYGDSAYEFALAPNMTELILLLAIIVQVRIPVVLISLSAVAGLLFMGYVTGRTSFSPFWAPVTLVVVLLATDPSTSPRRPLAQLMFGFAVGVLMRISGGVLEALFNLDVYGKVMGVALANLLVPWFESLAARISWQPRWLEPRWNPAHVMLWFALMSYGLLEPGVKAGNVHECTGCQRIHYNNNTVFAAFSPDHKLPCDSNPVFCEAYSFRREIDLWLHLKKTP